MSDHRRTPARPGKDMSRRRRIGIASLVILIFCVALVLTGRKIASDHEIEARGEQIPAAARNVAVLPDGNLVFAPDGSVAKALTDWLENNDGTPRSFEVGEGQFQDRAVEPIAKAKAHLPELVNMLNAYPKLKMTIVGHTDDQGNAADNEKLSLERARWLENYLVQSGIARDRIGVQARGALDPIADNSTPDGRSRNERLTLIFATAG